MKTPRRLRPSIKKDGIHPAFYNSIQLPWACEDCVHYSHPTDTRAGNCSFGYNCSYHLREQQVRDYETSGKMALCRFLEID